MDLSKFESWWPGLVFAFGCFILTELISRITVGLVPRLKVNHYWADIVLPSLPVLIGGLAGLLWSSFPYPLENPSWSFRVLLGIVAGYASAWAVRIVKAIIKDKTGVDVDVQVQAPAGSAVNVQVDPPKPPPPPNGQQ